MKKSEEIQKLKHYIEELLPLARRYADQRSTYVTFVINRIIDEIEIIFPDIKINDDLTLYNPGKYASDGMFGKWNPEKSQFEK